MIGSRYVPGGGVEGWPLKRHLMSKGVNLYARTLLGLRTKDCSGAFRCTARSCCGSSISTRSSPAAIPSRRRSSGGSSSSAARFAETPIMFADRERGQSKINGQEAKAAVRILFRLGVKNWLGV